jgi:cytochrome c
MDSHKFNMYAGAIIGSLLFFLLLGFFSDLIFVGRSHHEAPLAFAVATQEAAGSGEAKPKEIDYAPLLAKADPAAGEKIFSKCKACHSVEKGKNGIGPSLYGIIGEKIGEVPGYTFSDALKSKEGEWDFAKLNEWLTNPQAYAPGTKMSFKGLPKPEDRVDVIAYLNQQSDSPKQLVAPEVKSAAAEPAAAASATGEAAAGGTAPAAGEAAAAKGTETAAAGGAAATAAVSFASGDAAAGQKVFLKCRACHSPEKGKNGVGPSLYGIIGEKIAEVPGYNFSDALKAKSGEAWTPELLNQWLTSPKEFAPGTKMVFPGLKEEKDRVNVITYLNQQSDHPVELK